MSSPDPRDATLETLVFQTIGAASVCWSNMQAGAFTNAGVFDDRRANLLGQELLDFIRAHYVLRAA